MAHRSRSARAEVSRTETNRANASRSTGPRTPAGKDTSRRNALKHGLFARSITMASESLGEDRAEFAALHAELIEHHQPQGPEETLLVERIAATWWLLARLNTHSQYKLKRALDAGHDPIEALAESAVASPAEGRLERSLMRLHRNLAFLQKWNTDRHQRHAEAAFEAERAAKKAQRRSIVQEKLRWSRERGLMGTEGEEMEAGFVVPGDAEGGGELHQQSAA